ncbi:MAG: hypothetical protein QM484_08400 [Woeseiaceae bacterium]
MDFELTRSDNDAALLPQVDSIQIAENINVLTPFAKAYLGMFYVIDKALPAKDKVRLLANEQLSQAIFAGFIGSLKREELPSIEEVAHKKAENKEYSQGYAFLAGMDLIAKESLAQIKNLDTEIIDKAVGFYFSNTSEHKNIWFEYLLQEQKNTLITSIGKYWVAMLKNKTTYLPGRELILGDKPNVHVVQQNVLHLLKNWQYCKAKTLSQLLHLAFKHSDVNEFLDVCEHVLENDENLNERTRLYWIATAYLLSPDKYFATLSSYVGRVKQKIMPLLDFITLIMSSKNEININLDAKTVTQLLRMTGPVFPPQHHVYGAIGELDINSRNVMLMFYFLALSNDENAVTEIKSLRKARVMKIYSAVIDNVLELQMDKKNKEQYSFPSFNEYVDMLANNNCLQGRSNKFDLR